MRIGSAALNMRCFFAQYLGSDKRTSKLLTTTMRIPPTGAAFRTAASVVKSEGEFSILGGISFDALLIHASNTFLSSDIRRLLLRGDMGYTLVMNIVVLVSGHEDTPLIMKARMLSSSVSIADGCQYIRPAKRNPNQTLLTCTESCRPHPNGLENTGP